MSESDARAISDAFVIAELGFLPECEESGYEPKPPCWAFHYKIPMENGWQQDPSHWIVVVDVETKTARFFPVH